VAGNCLTGHGRDWKGMRIEDNWALDSSAMDDVENVVAQARAATSNADHQ